MTQALRLHVRILIIETIVLYILSYSLLFFYSLIYSIVYSLAKSGNLLIQQSFCAAHYSTINIRALAQTFKTSKASIQLTPPFHDLVVQIHEQVEHFIGLIEPWFFSI